MELAAIGIVGAVALLALSWQALRGRSSQPAPSANPPPNQAPPPTAERGLRAKRGSRANYDLGEVLAAAGVITPKERQRAERVNARLDRPRWLGDVLIELGYCVRPGIHQALTEGGHELPPGELLLKHQLITAEQLAEAWAALGPKAEEETTLEEWLEEQGYLSQAERLRALAERLGVPFVEATTLAQPGLLHRLPARYLRATQVVPLTDDKQAVTVAVSDPERFSLAGELEAALQSPVRFALASPAWIASQLKARELLVAPSQGELTPNEPADAEVEARFLHLVREASRLRATDVHLEPSCESADPAQESRLEVRLRVDGVLSPFEVLPGDFGARLVRHLKVLAHCSPVQRGHQQGRFKLDLGEVELELRVSTYVTVQGESAVLRLLLPTSSCLTLDELGLSPQPRRRMDTVLSRTSGLVLFAGPTGSGRTTSLYAALEHASGPGVKVLTAEQAVDHAIPGVAQSQIDSAKGRDLASTLRALMRQDPDVIALGEADDRAALDACMQAALIGHSVYSTVHAEDALSALIRLQHFDLDAYMLASTLSAVVAQRLVRKLCVECRQLDSVLVAGHADHLESQGIPRDHFQGRVVFRAEGCDACNGTGYVGRTGIFEVLVLDDRIRDLVLSGASPQHLRRHVQDRIDHRSLLENGLERVANGVTSMAEVLRVAPPAAPPRPLVIEQRTPQPASAMQEATPWTS